MSQNDFAEQFGISAATLRNWELGRRQPEGPARVLLTIIDRERRQSYEFWRRGRSGCPA
jgi:putative transcriptional regulator